MNKIDLKDYPALKELVETVKTNQPITIVDGIEEKYMLLTTTEYDRLQEGHSVNPFMRGFTPDINIISPDDLDLTEDDFEELKKMVLEALEGKLNKNNTTKS